MTSRACLPLLVVAVLACGAAPSPEDEVRAVLAALEQAAEAGDAGAFAELVSAAYQDPYGHDREKLRAFVAFHVMRSGRGREVVVRVREVRIGPSELQLRSPTARCAGPSPSLLEGSCPLPRAAVTLAVGLAGAGSRRGPGGLGAEVYAVDLDLVREDDAWRVVWAQWHAAPATDLL